MTNGWNRADTPVAKNYEWASSGPKRTFALRLHGDHYRCQTDRAPVLLNWLFRLLNRLEDIPSPSDEVLRQIAVVSKEAGAHSKRRLFDLLDDAYKYSPPKWMVEREFRKIWHALKADRNSWNIDLAGVDGNVRRLKMQYRAIADRRVRIGLILGVIARRINTAGANYPWTQRATMVEKEVVDLIFGLAEDEPAARN